jgi:RNA polymerase sigma factor (sigma-70 family)
VPIGTLDTFVHRLYTAAGAPGGGQTDQELLARFAAQRDEAAFAALVGRYGRMVRAVCRNVLGNDADADESLQATFLMLARRAGELREPESLAGWLHAVAYRTALTVRRAAVRRRAREARVQPAAIPPGPAVEASWRELQSILDAEVQRLPEKLRSPFVLCCLEGCALREAARRLGWKPGTVSGRLYEARKLLRSRLARRGVSLSAVLCGLALAGRGARAALPAELAAETVRVSLRTAGGVWATGTAGRLAALVLTVAGALAVAIGVSLRSPEASAADPKPAAAKPAEPAARPRVDRFGDALPEGATARLGSRRFDHSWTCDKIVWAPDGKVIATSGGFTSARRLCLWDAATGKELHDIAAQGSVPSVAFTPLGESIWALESRGVLQWDVATGKELRRIPFPQGAWTLALSPGGDTLAVSGRDQVVHVIEVATGRPLRELAGLEARSLAFSPDGGALAGAGPDGLVLAWDVTTGKERWRAKAHKNFAGTVAFAPDGKSVASAGNDGTIRLWDAATGKELRTLDDKVLDGPGAVTFSPDGRILAAPGPEGTVILWDPATGKEVRRWVAGALRVSGLCFSPDGRSLATGTTRGSRIHVWDVATAKPLRTAAEHDSVVETLSFSADGKTIWSTGPDKNLIRWDLPTGEGHMLFGGEHNGMFDRAAVSPDGQLVATAGRMNGRIRLWDTQGHELAELGRHEGGFANVAFSPDGKLLVSSGQDKELRLWDVATRKQIRRLGDPADLWNTFAFSPDGRRLAVSGGAALGRFGHSLPRVLDVATGKQLAHLQGTQPGVLIVFSADGRLLATGDCLDDSHRGPFLVSVWDSATGKQLGQVACAAKFGVACVALSPDGRLVAAGETEGSDVVRIWEVATRGEVACLRGHHSGVFSLAFSPDGKTLASGGGDATILLWDVSGRAIGGPIHPERLSPARLEQCWKDLQESEAAPAYRAVRALAGDPARAVPFLREHLRPVPVADPAKLKQLVADLNAKSYKVREQAEAEIVKLGDAAVPALRKVSEGNSEGEGRERAERLLETLASSTERLRSWRAVAALEYSATAEARQVLERLAKGSPDSRLTTEARVALERLKGLAAGRP